MVSIVGLGYVGITLACAFADRNIKIIAHDLNSSLIDDLNSGILAITDENLSLAFDTARSKGDLIKFTSKFDDVLMNDVIIICVGTSDNGKSQIDESALYKVIEDLSRRINSDKIIIIRSTVKIGTSKKIRDYLQEITTHHITVGFCPERTVEGRAFDELFTLPQIISSSNSKYLPEIQKLFAILNSNVLVASSLEAAEAAKIYSNLWRDFKFSFSNSLFRYVYEENLNGFEVINLINKDYPRGGVPLPGFVGGPCLSKDYLMLESGTNALTELQYIARKTNKEFIRWAASIVHNHYLNSNFTTPIGIIGGTFKGSPETNDWRSSPSLEIVEYIHALNPIKPLIYDKFKPNVSIDKNVLTKFDYTSNPKEFLNKCEVFMIQNNNLNLIDESFYDALSNLDKKIVIFDFWNILNKTKVNNPSLEIFYIDEILREKFEK